MSPAKLKWTRGHFRKLLVRTEKIARNDSGKVSSKQFGQDLASPGWIDFEHRKIRCQSNPYPTFFSVFLAARLVQMNMSLFLNRVRQFVIGQFHRITDFANDLRKISGRNINMEHRGNKTSKSRKRQMTTTFHPCGQRLHFWTEQAGNRFFRQWRIMICSTMVAPVTFLAIFGNTKRFFDEFNLLMDFRRFVGWSQNATARWAFVQGRLFDLINLLRLKSGTKIAFMSLLRIPFARLVYVSFACPAISAARQYPTTAASKNSTSSL